MMLHSNGLRSLPQLHVNDKVVCSMGMQEKVAPWQSCIIDRKAKTFLSALQFVGDAHTVQELEDFGELEDVVNAVLAEDK